MPKLTLAVYGKTDVGVERDHNEDAFLVAALDGHPDPVDTGEPIEIGERPVLLALSDGMGGHAAGEVASALTCKVLLEALRHPWDARESIEDLMKRAVVTVNQAVYDEGVRSGHVGMGATLTAVLSIARTAYFAEIGDSRAYLVRDGEIRQLTRDQSLVQALVDKGVLTDEQAKTFPQRNVILQAVGTRGPIEAVITTLSLRLGDRILVCSDGITNTVSDAEIVAVLRDHTPEAACTRLIDLGNQHGGPDNLTAIVAHYAGDALLTVTQA